jgi:hydroxypyruvate reductase
VTGPRAARPILRALFDAAVDAGAAAAALPPLLPAPPRGRTIAVGAGKAAAAMAQAVEAHWPGPLEGFVVTRDGFGAPTRRLRVIEAAHPVPDRRGLDAAQAMLAAVRGLSADDLVLCLMSGGASSLLVLPVEGVALAQKQALTRALLASGAPIEDMNAVRKHLSRIKGGRLAAAAHPARVVTLAISDVVGDDPAVIGSGPTVPDPTTFAQARAILAKCRIEPAPAIRAHLERAADETPKPGDPRLARAEFRLIVSPRLMLEAVAAKARALGVHPISLGDAVTGEAREVGAYHAKLARQYAANAVTPKPCVILSGGETTVTVRAAGGRGGPNTEYLIGLARGLAGAPGIHALAADTDGADGSEDNAGAFVSPDTLARAGALGLDPADALARNDAWRFFHALGDLLVTGPTRTNVNDLRAILILQDSGRAAPHDCAP